jgi:hypothetical protein
MLHNYGGRRGLYGNVEEMASQPLIDFAKANGTMVRRLLSVWDFLLRRLHMSIHISSCPVRLQVGMGITPEAIEVRRVVVRPHGLLQNAPSFFPNATSSEKDVQCSCTCFLFSKNNPIMYELMLNMAWESQTVNTTEWVATYARSRYGSSAASVQEAWKVLHAAVYSNENIDTAIVELLWVLMPHIRRTESSLCWEPNEHRASSDFLLVHTPSSLPAVRP